VAKPKEQQQSGKAKRTAAKWQIYITKLKEQRQNGKAM